MVLQYCRLLDHLKSPHFQFGEALESFLRAPFFTRLKGLFISDIPLNQLACLLGETWLEEDVFNAMSELTYFRHAIGVSAYIDSTIILPTTFLINARTVYQHATATSHPPKYTAEIAALRRRIKLFTPKIISMGLVANDHFTAIVYCPGSDVVTYADSLGNPPSSDILPVLQWIFDDILTPRIHSIQNGLVEIQGAGSGSCGIIAHNFIEVKIQKAHTESLKTTPELRLVKPWTAAQSQSFRDAVLQDFILYHHVAVHTNNLSECTSPYMGMNLSESGVEGLDVNASLGLLSYNDFNSVFPLVSAHSYIL